MRIRFWEKARCKRVASWAMRSVMRVWLAEGEMRSQNPHP
jgi:hypothetical protein